jgi:hypothetical protein
MRLRIPADGKDGMKLMGFLMSRGWGRCEGRGVDWTLEKDGLGCTVGRP